MGAKIINKHFLGETYFGMNKEKIANIVQQLSQQLESEATPTSLLITAQMLLAELKQEGSQPLPYGKNVCVVMPAILNITEEHIVHATAVENKKEIEDWSFKPAPQLIHAEEGSWNGMDLLNEIPTLAHQNGAEENQKNIRNDNGVNRAQSLQEMPIADLRKAIGVNDRFRYISELFRGDEAMFDRSIKTINGFNALREAELWIQRELKIKLSWNDDSALVKQFESLVKRRFME
jgi:hypothetical protein